MERNNHFIFISEVTILLIIIGVLIIQSIGMNKTSHEDNNDESMYMDSLYISNCNRIISYKNGATMYGKKRMILSLAAKYYYDEECDKTDGNLPIVNVLYCTEYNGYELYWIVRGNSMDFSSEEQVTDLECLGDFVALYSIKDSPAITYESIQQKGFKDDTGIMIIEELSWFLLTDPKTGRNIIVKNALSERDCLNYFDDFIKDESTKVKVNSCIDNVP